MRKYLTILIIVLLALMLLPSKNLDAAGNRTVLIGKLPYAITSIFSSNNFLFVGATNGFFISEDYGKHFYERDKGLGDFYITGVIYIDKKIFLGTQNAGLYISNDLGQSWQSQMSKLNCPTISSISVKDNVIYVTSLCTGFHYSTDFGKTWIVRNGGLPTLRTTAFIKTPEGRCFLGTDQFGLFYSDTLGETCVWDKFFSPYTITSISYVDSTLIIGTNEGIFTGNIRNDHFKKLGFIGGSPYIEKVLNVNGNAIAAVSGFGLFASNNGKDFYKFGSDTFSDVRTISFDGNNLYAGTNDGELYKIDLSLPYLVAPHKVTMGSVQKGKSLSGVIRVFNIGKGTLSGTVKSPYFIKFSKTKFIQNETLDFTIDTSTLSEGEYTEMITLSSNGGDRNAYISFVVQKPSSVILKLKIGSNVAFINGKSYYLDAPPFIVKSAGRTVVPVRFISEAFGAKVQWDGASRKVTIKKAPTEHRPPILIELWIGKKSVKVNLKNEVIDVAPLIVPPGRTMLPLRFIAEAFGSSVKWNPITREITIVYTP